MPEEKEYELKFLVPETDFDGIHVEIALKWAITRLNEQPYPMDDTAGRAAVNVLKRVHDRYMDTINAPQFKVAIPDALKW